MRLISIPLSLGSMGRNKGTEKAPEAIIEKLKEIWMSESYNEPYFTKQSLELPTHLEEAHKIIEKIDPEDSVILGGDHSLTYSTFKAFAKRFSDPGLLIFDAHPDCMQSFNPVTHENYLASLVEEQVIDPQNIILVGLRAFDKEEINFLKKHNIYFVPMKTIAQEGVMEMCHLVMEKARDIDNLYVSIDIDAVDAAFAPGTGYCEPGGLSSRELLLFIQKLKLLKNLRTWDLVEVNPEKETTLTVKLAAKILAELC